MDTELHPVVQLLLKRMESHPEEFEDGITARDTYTSIKPSRWYHAIEAVKDHGTKADKAALNAALGKIYMDEAHRWTMDELCNGEERRRQSQVEAEAQKLKQYALQQRLAQTQINQYNQLQNANVNTDIIPVSTDIIPVSNGGTLTTAIPPREWTDGAVESVKKALGLK